MTSKNSKNSKNSNNADNSGKSRYVYNPANFGRAVAPLYQPLPNVKSIDDFAIKMLNVVAGGNTSQQHMQFLTRKLNEIGAIVHKQNHNINISYEDKLTLLMAEAWALNHTISNNSTYVVLFCLYFVFILFLFCFYFVLFCF